METKMEKLQIQRCDDGSVFRDIAFELPGYYGTFHNDRLLASGAEYDCIKTISCPYLRQLIPVKKRNILLRNRKNHYTEWPRKYACFKSLEDSDFLEVYECDRFPECWRCCPKGFISPVPNVVS